MQSFTQLCFILNHCLSYPVIVKHNLIFLLYSDLLSIHLSQLKCKEKNFQLHLKANQLPIIQSFHQAIAALHIKGQLSFQDKGRNYLLPPTSEGSYKLFFNFYLYSFTARTLFKKIISLSFNLLIKFYIQNNINIFYVVAATNQIVIQETLKNLWAIPPLSSSVITAAAQRKTLNAMAPPIAGMGQMKHRSCVLPKSNSEIICSEVVFMLNILRLYSILRRGYYDLVTICLRWISSRKYILR